ncbi:MAG: site-2 protease family protein, partial [Gemmataceae bacterium]
MTTFYDLDLNRAPMRELSYSVSWYAMPLFALAKLVQAPITGFSHDPAVDSIAPFEVPEVALPRAVSARIADMTAELAGLGFRSLIYHAIEHPALGTNIYWATFLHDSGRAVARIQHIVCRAAVKTQTRLYPVIISAFDDGSFLLSSGFRRDSDDPAGVRTLHYPGAGCSELWEAHERSLADRLPEEPTRIRTTDEAGDTVERLHGRVRDFQLARGVFKPYPAPVEPPADGEPALDPSDAAVLAELDRLQRRKAGIWTGLLTLAISLVLFVAASKATKLWDVVWMLIPILLFHEAGHYVAMRLFGYRNLRMFFIPFLGAAVTGRHYNVAGWKKAIVALAGPVPGIVLGIAIGAVGLHLHRPQVTSAAALMLFLNGFNLVPILPLDGGWVVHTVLFVRHPVLDGVFRLLAIAALFGIGLLVEDKVLYVLPGLMLLGLPSTWRIARTAHRLRAEHTPAMSPDSQSIPPESALRILHALRGGVPRKFQANLMAKLVAQVFEMLNARPPGAVASLALLGVQTASFVAAVVFAVVFTVGLNSPLLNRFGFGPDRELKHQYRPGATDEWRGPEAPPHLSPDDDTIIATYRNESGAEAAFRALRAELPETATLRWFGQSVIVTMPVDDERDGRAQRLRKSAREVLVSGPDARVLVKLSCQTGSDPQAAQLEAELRQYTSAPNVALLMPPWSAAWQELPEADRQRFRKARRTLDRMQQVPARAAEKPEVRAIMNRAISQVAARDQAAMQEGMKQYAEALDAEANRLVEEIRNEGEATVDPAVIDLWERRQQRIKGPALPVPGLMDPAAAREQAAAWQRDISALDQQLAQRMGSPPLRNGAPAAGSDQDGMFGSYAYRQGRRINIGACSFRVIGRGLPALAEWL